MYGIFTYMYQIHHTWMVWVPQPLFNSPPSGRNISKEVVAKLLDCGARVDPPSSGGSFLDQTSCDLKSKIWSLKHLGKIPSSNKKLWKFPVPTRNFGNSQFQQETLEIPSSNKKLWKFPVPTRNFGSMIFIYVCV